MAVEREALDVRTVGFEPIALGITPAKLILPLQLAPSQHYHRPVGIHPALHGALARLFEDIVQRFRQVREPLGQILFERQHMHNREIAFLASIALFFGLRVGEQPS
jgi:hypothetical protein